MNKIEVISVNIKDWILSIETPSLEERAKRLEEIGAPKIMVEGTWKLVREMKEGTLKIGGNKELLNEEAVNPQKKKGRGGAVYVEFENGVRYFPSAKYGRFITRN
jgi:hypothetical protein